VGMGQEAGIAASLLVLSAIFHFGIQPYTDEAGNISKAIPAYIPWLVVLVVSLFVFAKQAGTVNWVLMSEIFPAKIR
ncbi:MFS transporter, partial [Pauljensenia sp. UMB0018B]|nr:MFS transporter [Pauljensenia sp. UMB0018B]